MGKKEICRVSFEISVVSQRIEWQSWSPSLRPAPRQPRRYCVLSVRAEAAPCDRRKDRRENRVLFSTTAAHDPKNIEAVIASYWPCPAPQLYPSCFTQTVNPRIL